MDFCNLSKQFFPNKPYFSFTACYISSSFVKFNVSFAFNLPSPLMAVAPQPPYYI